MGLLNTFNRVLTMLKIYNTLYERRLQNTDTSKDYNVYYIF